VVVIDDGDLVPQMPAVPKLFTADEDSKLIVLREKLSGLARWDQITKDFNRKFSQAPRSTGSLRSRYNDALQEGARRQIQGTVDQRARAIDTFRENGIEFQVNDSISDSASEREEDGDDEDDKEAEEGFRDGSGEDGKLEHEEPE
jgi:hypothetical protein